MVGALKSDSQAGAAMQKIKSNGFASRMSGISQMRLARFAAAGMAIALCASLAACAETTSAYPNLAKIADAENILTPEERQKALEDMQKQQQSHSSDAAKQIEKR